MGSTTKRFNADRYQRIGTVSEVRRYISGNRFWKVFLLSFLVAAVIFTLALYAMVTHFHSGL